MIRQLAMGLLSATGLLHAWHRRRNRDVLTVISLHRVLSEDDPRWSGADPLYTVSARFFDQLLAWLPRHYSVVGLQQLEDARTAGKPLPPCPLLITFDDGWADNFQVALPLLKRHALPAVLFCAGDAIDRHEGFFQERLICAWRRGRLGEPELLQLWTSCGVAAPPAPVTGESAVRQLVSRLQALGPDARAGVLEPLRAQLRDDSRQMLTAAELKALAQADVAVGTHGKQHEPLPDVVDLAAELRDSRRQVAQAADLPEERVASLSFPFSKQNARVVAEAQGQGYRLLFGGGLSLTPLGNGVPDLLARVGITAGPLQDRRGNLRPTRLAAYLFRRPIRALRTG
jgi:peptidoglycan/xylan/chitin deacetylase (PgdA/CDA1 family)